MHQIDFIEEEYKKQLDAFLNSRFFQIIENGKATSDDYDQFISGICSVHLLSEQVMAQVFSISPPAAKARVRENLLCEMGLTREGDSHPNLLRKLKNGVGMSESKWAKIEEESQKLFHKLLDAPIMFSTLKEFGFSIMLEVFAFEWMLSKLARRFGNALQMHRGLSASDLEWFFIHAIKDIQHAKEAFETLSDYIEYHTFDDETVESIVEITFRENIFIKRYFGELTLAEETGAFSD